MKNDITLYHTEHGLGEPLILLHGNGESSDIFSELREMYAKQFRVLTPDTRGHGRTPRGDGSLTLTRCAEDLYIWMCQKGITQARLLGFSDGANIAMLFALNHPEMVSKMVLNSGNLTPSGLDPALLCSFRRTYFSLCLRRIFMKKGREAYTSALRRAELLRLMVCEPHISPAVLDRFSFPVLVIAGESDLIRRKHTEKIAASIPGASLSFIPGHHDVCVTNPELFYRSTIDFLL